MATPCTSLLGCGFSGFGQLELSPLSSSHTQLRESKESTRDSSTSPCQATVHSGQSHEAEVAVSTLRVVINFRTTEHPREVCISSAWDATLVFVHFPNFWASFSSAKWHPILSQVERQHLSKEEGIRQVWEHGSSSLMLLTTSKRALLVNHKESNQLNCSDLNLPNLQTFLALSDSQTYCLLSNGQLYQCSIEEESLSFSLGPHISPSLTFTKATCGVDHVLLLTDTGCVYSYGLSTRGQLGHGDIYPVKEPCLVEALAGIRVKAIACGNWHSLALSEYGDVYSWGWNEHGQLGPSLGEFQPVVSVPTLVEWGKEEDRNFTAISAGNRHSAALSDKGTVYVWGWNGYGQLGSVPDSSSSVRVLCNLKYIDSACLQLSHWSTFVVCSQ